MFVLLSLPWQGDEADCFYIVESGEVKIMIRSKVSKASGPKTEAAPCWSDKMEPFLPSLNNNAHHTRFSKDNGKYADATSLWVFLVVGLVGLGGPTHRTQAQPIRMLLDR